MYQIFLKKDYENERETHDTRFRAELQAVDAAAAASGRRRAPVDPVERVRGKVELKTDHAARQLKQHFFPFSIHPTLV